MEQLNNKYYHDNVMSNCSQSKRVSSSVVNKVISNINYQIISKRHEENANNDCSDCDIDCEGESETHSDCSQQAVPEYCQVVKFTDEKGNTKELLFPKNLDLDRPKRARTTFNHHQMNVLETAFATNQYLVGKDRKALSKKLKLSEAQIKVWYQNRRTKYKREQCKEKEQMEATKESVAANNIMKILQKHQLPIPSPLSASSSPATSSSSSSASPISSTSTNFALPHAAIPTMPTINAHHHAHQQLHPNFHHVANSFTPSINVNPIFHPNNYYLQPPNNYFRSYCIEGE